MEVFDLREAIIPFALLHICNHFKQMQPGEMIEIITREAGIAEDIERILPAPVRETLIREQPCEEAGREFRIQLKKVVQPESLTKQERE